MTQFLDWFNTASQDEPLIKAGLAHLWFVTVHPMDDGNGRMGRAVGDLALAASKALRNATTAYRRKSSANAKTITTNSNAPMNERQIKLLNKLLDGFDGKLTTSKWAAIAKCSQDTALRDINELLERGVLMRSEASGRSTSYEMGSLA
jgi:Fic family protein